MPVPPLQYHYLFSASGGELDSLSHVQLDDCVKCIEENKDVIVGIKIRLSESISNAGVNEEEAYR
jgi:predicted amidohydrolase